MGVLRSLARGTALAGAVVVGGALVVTARNLLATPQPLASALEGESHIFRFRNGDIFYKVRGPADAQPILLLHSIHLSASSFEWRKNFSALSQSFRVYAPDLPGFGLSDRPSIEYSPDMYIHLVSDFAREVIARPVMLVARGQSAAYATRAAHLDSQLFRRLAFISPSGILPAPAAERQAWPARPGGALRGILRRLGESSLAQVPYAFLTTRAALSLFIARQSYADPEQITPDVVDQFFATTHQFGARYAPLAFMSGKLDTDVADDFAALPQPILLVWGEQDTINPPTSAGALGKMNAHARLELIQAAGNAVQDEQASEINELLRAWFLAPPELVDPLSKAQAPARAETPGETAKLFTQREAQKIAETAHQAPAAPTPTSAELSEQEAPAAATPGAPATPRAARRRPPSKTTTPGEAKPDRAAQQAPQQEDTRHASPDTGHKPPRASGDKKKVE